MSGWSGNKLGDLWVGGKWSISRRSGASSQSRSRLRGMVKLPTGDKSSGASTGKADVAVDAVASKELNERVEFAGYGGLIFRGSPSEVEETNGVPLGLRHRARRRASRCASRLNCSGEQYFKDTLTTNTELVARRRVDPPGRLRPPTSSRRSRSISGLTWQAPAGLFAGVGWTWRPTVDSRDTYLSQYTNGAGDKMDIVGAHRLPPGRADLRAAAAPAAAAAAAAAESAADGEGALRAVHGRDAARRPR